MCNTSDTFRASHQIYHEAQGYLFDNVVIFHSYGSEFKSFQNSVGMLSCQPCRTIFSNGPVLRGMILEVGHPSDEALAGHMTRAMSVALSEAKSPLVVKRLVIVFHACVWGHVATEHEFLSAVQKITVTEMVQIICHGPVGPDMRFIPLVLGMNRQAVPFGNGLVYTSG